MIMSPGLSVPYSVKKSSQHLPHACLAFAMSIVTAVNEPCEGLEKHGFAYQHATRFPLEQGPE
jgi:hypothetical protein